MEINGDPSVLAGEADSGLAALVVLLGMLERQADVDRLRHEIGHGSPAGADDIVRLARREGVRARTQAANWPSLSRSPLPAIAEMDDGFVILGRVGDDEALVQDPLSGQISVLQRAEFERRYAGQLILMTTRERVAGGERRFDASWFIPALVRYRRLLGEVFLASLFIQILGLISPIFFRSLLIRY